MKNKISFAELMQQNGFQHMGKTTYDGRFIYEREWRKTTDLAWYGEKESTYRIEGYESYGTPIIRLYENGRPLGMRDYASPKRANQRHPRDPPLRRVYHVRGGAAMNRQFEAWVPLRQKRTSFP